MPVEDQGVFAPPELVGHEPRKDYNAVLEYDISGADDALDLVGMAASIKSQSGFWQQVGTGLIATAIWTLFVTGVIFAAAIFGSDFIDAWRASSPVAIIPQ